MLKRFFHIKTEQIFDENEEIFLFLHRHWLSMLPIILAMFFLILIPIVIFLIFFYFGGFDFLNALDFSVAPSKILVFFFAVYFLFLNFFFLCAWLQYYLDVTIVTNNRIINIEQINVFSRQVSAAKFDFVQDVKTETEGFLQRIFNYGTVTIQTAGEQPNFILENIPQPTAVSRKILSVIRKENFVAESLKPVKERLEQHEKEILNKLIEGKQKKFLKKAKIKKKKIKPKKIEKDDSVFVSKNKQSGEINLE